MATGRYVLAAGAIDERVAERVGGKALALARLQRAGMTVPPFVAVTTDAYAAYLDATGLRPRILFELERKDAADMRWEEMWDAALRIRHLFLTTALPDPLGDALRAALGPPFEGVATVVRSSAPGEDSARASFAGLHESYVNVRGLDEVIGHVRLVWASLWSDAALLYRRELGLDPRQSTMAVVVQQIVEGHASGVAFSRHPEDEEKALVEAVHGLNQGLVDGTVEPDRWELERRSGEPLAHHPAERRDMMAPAADGVHLVPLPEPLRDRPPLDARGLARVHRLARLAEDSFARPQDVEWTLRADELFTLQSRPITTLASDGRSAYLALRRSHDSLEMLRRRIEDEALPAMAAEAAEMAAVDLTALDDAALRAEIERRLERHGHWVDVYTRDFIPFAHGVRLFGQVYNDVLAPEDPYEFTALLAATPMASLRRNAALADVAGLLREGDERAAADALDRFLDEFGVAADAASRDEERATMLAVARRLAAGAGDPRGSRRAPDELEARLLEAAGPEAQERAAALLDLARASWRLRDDDNLYLDRVAAQVRAALTEAEQRSWAPEPTWSLREVVMPSARGPSQTDRIPRRDGAETDEPGDTTTRARQLVGQPAGPGLGVGPARVVLTRDDLLAFEQGEVLVCDAIEPAMTFVVPLCAGIVERRGGMLIHGAIIAREYGLPCVTGVPRATELIRSGQPVTVDGYLGIVVVGAD